MSVLRSKLDEMFHDSCALNGWPFNNQHASYHCFRKLIEIISKRFRPLALCQLCISNDVVKACFRCHVEGIGLFCWTGMKLISVCLDYIYINICSVWKMLGQNCLTWFFPLHIALKFVWNGKTNTWWVDLFSSNLTFSIKQWSKIAQLMWPWITKIFK